MGTSEIGVLAKTLRPADVLLVEGNTRVATAIKYLTQSTWSHSAIYVGPIADRTEENGEPHVLIEAHPEYGVISAPLSRYTNVHARICRPVGLSNENVSAVLAFAIERIGQQYDLRNLFDLLRYFLPTPPVPSRFRRRMIALGAGSPTRAICSTLIAQAFQSINYPILPPIGIIERAASRENNSAIGKHNRQEILHIRHFSLFVPRDFDISPYFAIVKPTLENGFDFHQVSWAAGKAEPEEFG